MKITINIASCFIMYGYYRQNQELERYSASMLEDKLRLQEEADMLTQRLEAVLHDKFERKTFDADTPIDKTLAYLQCVIKVSFFCSCIFQFCSTKSVRGSLSMLTAPLTRPWHTHSV